MVRAIGRRIPYSATLPPSIDSFEAGLRSMDEGYRLNHRGPGDIGNYRYQAAGPGAGRMLCDNPYPCEFDQGILEGMYERFRPEGSTGLRLSHEVWVCRERGARVCTYHLRW
jgi:hypothetical protein